MFWKLVEFVEDGSIAGVPKPWIKKYKNYWVCYWPDKNVESLRRRIIQPPMKKNSKQNYKCKILLEGEEFSTFQEALEQELKLTTLAPSRSYKPRFIKSGGKNEQRSQPLKAEPLISEPMFIRKLSDVENSSTPGNRSDLEPSVDGDKAMTTESLLISELLIPKQLISEQLIYKPLNSKPLVNKPPLVEPQLNAEPLLPTECHELSVEIAQPMVVESIQEFTMEVPFTAENRSDSAQSINSGQLLTTVSPMHKQTPIIVDLLSSESLIPEQLICKPLNSKPLVNKPPLVEPQLNAEPLLPTECHELSVEIAQPMVVESIQTNVVASNPVESTGSRFWKKMFLDNYRLETNKDVYVNQISDSLVNILETTNTVMATPFLTGSVGTEAVMTEAVITETVMNETEITKPVINRPEIVTEVDSICLHSPSTTEHSFTTENRNDLKQSVNSDQSLVIGSLINEQPPMTVQQLLDIELPSTFDTNLKNAEDMERLLTNPVPNILGPLNNDQIFELLYSESLLDDWMLIQRPLIAENQMNVEQLLSTEQLMNTSQQPTTQRMDQATIISESFIAQSLISGPFVSETMSNINDCFPFPVDWMDVLEQNDRDATLGNVAELPPNKRNESSATETCVLKAMNQDIESSADSQCCTDGYDSCVSFEADYSDEQQQQQTKGIVECQIQHLGSNNYQDSQSYLYTKNNSRKSNLYLRCKNNIKHHCPARVTVRDKNFQEARLTTNHNHPPEKKNLDRQIFDKKLEENIDRDPFQTPRQVYLATKKDILNKIDTTYIPSLKKLEGFIYRRQRKYVPKLPSTIEEFLESVADKRYSDFFTKDQRNLPFYRGCWMSKKGERNLAFISETTLKLVNTMNHISLFMDGTYKALPHHLQFRQLYVISVTYENQCYPLAYIFMEKKTFSSYDCIFQNLKFLMPSVEVVKLMTDYEAATRKALKKHYPNARIAGCFFHYVQAIVKRSKSFGLRKDEKFTEAVKKLCYLALLPNEFVLKGFECIDKLVSHFGSTRWERFRKYWMKQWAPANISVYGLGDRTNNFSESNNKSLNLFLIKHHPNIWNLIKNLKLLEMDKSDKITRAKLGEIFVPKKNNDSLAFDTKLQLATDLFEKDQDVGRFLDRVSYGANIELFVKDQVSIMDDFNDVDVDDEIDDEVVPNDYNRESDLRKNHPRQAVSQRKEK